MSDLVGNSEDRFCCDMAQFLYISGGGVTAETGAKGELPQFYIDKNEPHCEKTGLRGFRPGPT